MAFLPDSAEVKLVDMARNLNASIFGCDKHQLFHSWQSTSAGWDTGTSTLQNTDVFINVWLQIQTDGTYKKYDWTVKVDPDAVLVPGRLQAHIRALRAPPDTPIYLKNNGMDKGLGNNGFLGAIEVFSQRALDIYFDNWQGCKDTLGLATGEDGFLKGCMDAMGIGFMLDRDMFFPDKSAGACTNQGRAGFHPIKEAWDWQCCWDMVMGKPHTVEFGKCLK
jgi:hypothetical protein